MADQNFAKRMLAAIEEALLKNVGVGSVTTDGTTIQFTSMVQLQQQYEIWKRKASTSSRVKTIDLSL